MIIKLINIYDHFYGLLIIEHYLTLNLESSELGMIYVDHEVEIQLVHSFELSEFVIFYDNHEILRVITTAYLVR